MGLIEISDTAYNADFQKKVEGAMLIIAGYIVGEATAIGKEILGSKRHETGKGVIRGQHIVEFSRMVAANPAITLNGVNAPDSDIEFTVVTVWNDIAGVLNSEL